MREISRCVFSRDTLGTRREFLRCVKICRVWIEVNIFYVCLGLAWNHAFDTTWFHALCERDFKGRKFSGFQRDATIIIVSYCPKKNKVATLLNTIINDKDIVESPGETKPEIIQYYNSTKGGVDTMIQISGTQTFVLLLPCYFYNIFPCWRCS